MTSRVLPRSSRSKNLSQYGHRIGSTAGIVSMGVPHQGQSISLCILKLQVKGVFGRVIDHRDIIEGQSAGQDWLQRLVMEDHYLQSGLGQGVSGDDFQFLDGDRIVLSGIAGQDGARSEEHTSELQS